MADRPMRRAGRICGSCVRMALGTRPCTTITRRFDIPRTDSQAYVSIYNGVDTLLISALSKEGYTIDDLLLLVFGRKYVIGK